MTDIPLKRGGNSLTRSQPLCFLLGMHSAGCALVDCVFDFLRYASTWCAVNDAFIVGSTRCGVNAFDATLTRSLLTVIVRLALALACCGYARNKSVGVPLMWPHAIGSENAVCQLGPPTYLKCPCTDLHLPLSLHDRK